MKTKNDAKFEEESTYGFKIDTAIWGILTWALKCLKHLHFNGLLLTKVYNVWAKQVQQNYVDGTENWWRNWRKTDLRFPKWHEEFGKLSQAEK